MGAAPTDQSLGTWQEGEGYKEKQEQESFCCFNPKEALEVSLTLIHSVIWN